MRELRSAAKRFGMMTLGLREMKRDLEEGRQDVRETLLALIDGMIAMLECVDTCLTDELADVKRLAGAGTTIRERNGG
jgi:hypothetical protein